MMDSGIGTYLRARHHRTLLNQEGIWQQKLTDGKRTPSDLVVKNYGDSTKPLDGNGNGTYQKVNGNKEITGGLSSIHTREIT